MATAAWPWGSRTSSRPRARAWPCTQGTLNRHPTFGLPIKPGHEHRRPDAKSLLKAVKNLFLDDPAFTGVQNASVRVQGPVANRDGRGDPGQGQVVPITLDVKR
jgi:hypothetical protein